MNHKEYNINSAMDKILAAQLKESNRQIRRMLWKTYAPLIIGGVLIEIGLFASIVYLAVVMSK